MKGDVRGVSPVIATILLIALTVVAVGTIAMFLGTISPGKPPISVVVYLENWTANSLRFYHGGGSTINKSELKLTISPGSTLDPVTTSGTWAVGETMSLTGLSGITGNSIITLVYKPANQIIYRENLTTWSPR